MLPILLAGEADCEAIGLGLLDQPVNAWSSLAYVAAAAWLVSRGAGRGERWAYAAAVSLNGWGGLAYHGGASTLGHWLHDWGILVTLGAMLLVDEGRRRGRPFGPAAWAAAALVLAVVAVSPAAALAASAVLGALVVVSEVLLRRAGLRPWRRADTVLVVSLTVALAVKLLSGTGAPLCDSDSLLQGHALWHVLTAVAMAAWGASALRAERVSPPARSTPA